MATHDHVRAPGHALPHRANRELQHPGDPTEAGHPQARYPASRGCIERPVARNSRSENSDLGIGEAAGQLEQPGLDAAALGGKVPGEKQDLHRGQECLALARVCSRAFRSANALRRSHSRWTYTRPRRAWVRASSWWRATHTNAFAMACGSLRGVSRAYPSSWTAIPPTAVATTGVPH